MKQINKIAKVASSAEQHGHGVSYNSPHPAEAKKNAEQAAAHNRDLQRIERLHQRGLKK
jgi:hypothetical protein